MLVSPFVQMWPELRRALARAVARGVSITLITRGPRGRPRGEDLLVFEELEAKIMEVTALHLKAYLSEREALHTSVNLTRQSLDQSLESSLLFDRKTDRDDPLVGLLAGDPLGQTADGPRAVSGHAAPRRRGWRRRP